MTKHIRVRASGNGGAGSNDQPGELADFTPAFLWLLRDFYLRLEEDGRQVRGGCCRHAACTGCCGCRVDKPAGCRFR